LTTHRGYDAGALSLARSISAAFGAPLVASDVSRLVVELNRSQRHPKLFSDPMKAAGPELRAMAIREIHEPYRRTVRAAIADARASGATVVHVSAHSFTPVLDGVARGADVGLLYDPARRLESSLCSAWQAALRGRAPDWRVRRNYPYRGTSDGLTTALRREWPASLYAGIEIEVNQALCFAGARTWTNARRAIVLALGDAMGTMRGLGSRILHSHTSADQ
jgi:predicted N-formylglutamate amidohydrolase